MATLEDISMYIEWCDDQLAKTVDFWMKHSIDSKNGGFYNCLSKNGDVFDTLKHSWMQARQVWMLSRLYNDLEVYHTKEILAAAVQGGEFLLNAVKVKGENRCYYIVTETGQPFSYDNRPYTECFFIMALAELYRVTGEMKYQVVAEEMLQQLIHWVCVDDSGLGVVRLSGTPPTRELGRPMILLNVLTEFCGDNVELREKYSQQFEWTVTHIQMHFDGQWVHEHVLTDGSGGFPEGSLGRLTTPGHAIEAGWFLLKEANMRKDEKLQQIAIKHFIEIPWAYGWDQQYGGLYYFLDTGGHCPVQFEWNVKLWWPLCEALVALMMSYEVTRDPKHWALIKQCYQYTAAKFPDNENGEWFGQLDRKGEVTHTFKGFQFKGFFHLPRTLLFCKQILEKLIKEL